jgi:hypothetical protein
LFVAIVSSNLFGQSSDVTVVKTVANNYANYDWDKNIYTYVEPRHLVDFDITFKKDSIIVSDWNNTAYRIIKKNAEVINQYGKQTYYEICDEDNISCYFVFKNDDKTSAPMFTIVYSNVTYNYYTK